MIYAQIKAGNKLHLVFEAGEGRDACNIVNKGMLSYPICGQKCENSYRMTINFPLGHACKRCLKVYHLMMKHK